MVAKGPGAFQSSDKTFELGNSSDAAEEETLAQRQSPAGEAAQVYGQLV